MYLKAVIFDLDDTLYPEQSYVASGFASVAQLLAKFLGERKEALQKEMLALLKLHGRGRIFNHLLENRGIQDEGIIAKLVDNYRQHLPDIQLYPGAKEVLLQLRCLKFKLGVLTDGLAIMQRNKLHALGILEFVDVAICTDDLGGRPYWKPHPAGFIKVLQVLQVQAGDALFVGNDPDKDISGARAVGLFAAPIHCQGMVRSPGVFPINTLSDLLPLVA